MGDAVELETEMEDRNSKMEIRKTRNMGMGTREIVPIRLGW